MFFSLCSRKLEKKQLNCTISCLFVGDVVVLPIVLVQKIVWFGELITINHGYQRGKLVINNGIFSFVTSDSHLELPLLVPAKQPDHTISGPKKITISQSASSIYPEKPCHFSFRNSFAQFTLKSINIRTYLLLFAYSALWNKWNCVRWSREHSFVKYVISTYRGKIRIFI